LSPCSADYFRRKSQRVLSGDIDHDTTINSRRREQARFGPLPGYNKGPLVERSAGFFLKPARVPTGGIEYPPRVDRTRRNEQAWCGPLSGYKKVYSSDVQRGILVNEMSLFQGGALQRRWFDFRRVLRSARLHQFPLCCLPFLKASFSCSAQRRASSLPAPSKSFMINEWSREFY
jgi:hypothetical protein